jgi:hypothetical protein
VDGGPHSRREETEKLSTVTPVERKLGWVEFTCPKHGFLVATTHEAAVTCKCGKHALMFRTGKPMHREQIRRLRLARNREKASHER